MPPTPQQMLIKGFAQWQRMSNLSATAKVIFLETDDDGKYAAIGELSEYFFVHQNEQKNGENVIWLRVLNKPEVADLFTDASNLVIQNFNPVFDNFVFTINKQFNLPSYAAITIDRRIDPSTKPYNP